MSIYHFFICIGFFVLGILIIVMNRILAKSVGKKFDELLLKNNIKLPPTFVFLPGTSEASMRAASYAMNIVLHKDEEWRLKQKKDWYDSFDFRAYASKMDVLLSWIYELLLLAVVMLLIVLIITVIFHIK